MKILIDPNLCSGHGRCYSLSPSVFDCDDDGFSVPRGEIIEVPESEERAALLGVNSCPEGAIAVVDAAGVPAPAPGAAQSR